MSNAGRPSTYDESIIDEICERLASREPIHKIAADKHMPAESTIYKWLHEKSEFSEKYARARERLADKYADEIVTIADTEESADRARVRIDARKWAAGKLACKKYGDKVQYAGDKDNPLEANVVMKHVIAFKVPCDGSG